VIRCRSVLPCNRIMTRPRVPPEQRQRTAQACESCKRRKQKCNGLCPCNTCDKRKFTCVYSDRDIGSPEEGRLPAKRRAIEGDSPFNYDDATAQTPDVLQQASPPSLHWPTSSVYDRPDAGAHPTNRTHETIHRTPRPTIEVAVHSAHLLPTAHTPGEARGTASRDTTVLSADEEAVIYSQSRMLQDPSGRVLYIGDSATLSFLQLLRMMVETVSGPSPFTSDPRRHKIVEGQYSLPPGYRHAHLLPDSQTATVLVEAFFTNTHGLLQVFERDRFMEQLDRCLADPLSVEPSWLCLLNLVFAIGLTMATPLPGSPEAMLIDKLRGGHLDRAEVFYLNAKSLNDPMAGLEAQDLWSVQALLLMAVYMLAKSKRNTAFVLLGMAARSAHAMGIHREETMVIFSPDEQTQRKDLWRSIFVIDRLLSCSLGRPAAISEDDCSGNALQPPHRIVEEPFSLGIHSIPDYKETGPHALEAAVRSCSVIGVILRRVYQQRKISTRLAQEIADVCKAWPRALPAMLHWRQAAHASPGQGVAILHVNLFYCHSIILLTRPFFLYILNMETQRHVNQASARGPRPYLRMEKFSEACVIASTHTILLVQNAFDVGHLSRRNPAVIYFLFAASLVILANEFAGLYKVEASDTCMRNAVNIMNYCAESDPQASRLVYILSSFRDVVAQQRMRRKQDQADNATLPSIGTQIHNAAGAAQPQPMQSVNVGGLVSSTADAMSADTRPHEVAIHVHPGMQTTPLPDATPTPHPLNHQAMMHNPPSQDFSVHLTPIKGPAVSTANSDPFGTGPTIYALNTPARVPSVSTMLDLSALEATRVPSLHPEESGQDEQIDFDALWAWPSNAPVMGSPGDYDGLVERVQGISDSAVPMYGVSREGAGLGVEM